MCWVFIAGIVASSKATQASIGQAKTGLAELFARVSAKLAHLQSCCSCEAITAEAHALLATWGREEEIIRRVFMNNFVTPTNAGVEVADKTTLSRRSLFKLGGLTAAAVAATSLVGQPVQAVAAEEEAAAPNNVPSFLVPP